MTRTQPNGTRKGEIDTEQNIWHETARNGTKRDEMDVLGQRKGRLKRCSRMREDRKVSKQAERVWRHVSALCSSQCRKHPNRDAAVIEHAPLKAFPLDENQSWFDCKPCRGSAKKMRRNVQFTCLCAARYDEPFQR